MRFGRRAIILALVVVATATAGVAAGSLSASADGDETAGYTDSHGIIDVRKMPDRIPVVGADGKPMRDANGKVVTVSRDELFAPPPPPSPGSVAKTSSSGVSVASSSSDGGAATGENVIDTLRRGRSVDGR